MESKVSVNLGVGMVNEMFIESRNDEGVDKYYHRIAGQAEFDAF